MQVHYLEIVTKEVEATCETYAKIYATEFGDADPGLGNARTAKLSNGGMIGVRAPMEGEVPDFTIRPYFLVDDIDTATELAVDAGGNLAMAPTEIPGHGKFAIYFLDGNQFGLWQL